MANITQKQQSIWQGDKSRRDAARAAFTDSNRQKRCEIDGCFNLRRYRQRWCSKHSRNSLLWGHPEARAITQTRQEGKEFREHRKRIMRFLKKHDWHVAVHRATYIMATLISLGVEKGWRDVTQNTSGVLPFEDHVVSRAGCLDGTSTIDIADRELRRLRDEGVDPVKCLATLIACHRYANTARPMPMAGKNFKVLKYAMANQVFKLARAPRPQFWRATPSAKQRYPEAPTNARRICGELFQLLLGPFIINVNATLDREDQQAWERNQALLTPFPSPSSSSLPQEGSEPV